MAIYADKNSYSARDAGSVSEQAAKYFRRFQRDK